ncbi:MAG: bifunctional folylpolyglutamate synthase/dihydrofolate synthase [bacterium]|nr:bifunctional folylpolyglutamate synthase/dihydrofolate synthase [bacterium]
MRTYRSAINWLDSLVNFERLPPVAYKSNNFNLARVKRVLSALDSPHRQVQTIHIAGTKGKGSTATMLAQMLRHAGYKVGLYTSPHLHVVRERITINSRMISEARFARLARKVIDATAERDTLTYFEALTAIAFTYFAEEKVRVAVIETGVGGRLDSTNVISPEVCGITSISFDHMAQLGTSLAAIAEEKAGIMKSGVPVVSAPQVPEVKKVLREVAARSRAELRLTGEDIKFTYRFESARPVGPHTRLSLTTDRSRFEHLHVPLLGEHQAINCGLALSMLDALKGRGSEIDDQKAIAGLASVELPGRMEMISEEPRILVDGAHNAASVEALMRAIGQNIPYDSMVVIFGCHKDKDVAGMLRHIQLGSDKTIFTSTGSPRSMDPADLAAAYAEQTGKMSQVAYTLSEAVQIASSAVTREDLICITGSFYLVGLAKRKLQKK